MAPNQSLARHGGRGPARPSQGDCAVSRRPAQCPLGSQTTCSICGSAPAVRLRRPLSGGGRKPGTYETSKGGFAESVLKRVLRVLPTSPVLGTFPDFKQARIPAGSTRLFLGDTWSIWLRVPLPAWASHPGGTRDALPSRRPTASMPEPRAVPVPSRDTGRGQGLPWGPAPTDGPALGPGRKSGSEAADTAFPESKASAGPGYDSGNAVCPQRGWGRGGTRAEGQLLWSKKWAAQWGQAGSPLSTRLHHTFPPARMVPPGKLRPQEPITECLPAVSTLLKLLTWRGSPGPAGGGEAEIFRAGVPLPGGPGLPCPTPDCPPASPASLTHPHSRDQGPVAGDTTGHTGHIPTHLASMYPPHAPGLSTPAPYTWPHTPGLQTPAPHT